MELQQYEKEHLQRLRKLLPECTVLLNNNGAFPLEAPGKLALYGSGARNTIKGGTGSGEVNSRYFVNVEQGLEEGGFTITTKSWLDAYEQVRVEAKKQFLKDIRARAKQKHTNPIIEGMGAVMPEPEYELPLDGEGDVAVYVLSRISGEGNDRNAEPGDILLSETERRDILALNEKYKKFLLVINTGGPVDLSPVKNVQNILVLSQLGVDTGTALADILLGKANPSGKLTTTWSKWEDYCTIGEFGGMLDVCYNEGVYVGYRYFDSVGKQPMYPFGFGLSYTNFEIACNDVTANGQHILVKANVKNVGRYPGKEVVQLYVSVPAGKLDQPYQTLAAFEKTAELEIGESQEMTLAFDLAEIASYDAQNASYILEQGDYILRLGNSSVSTEVCGIVRLDSDALVRKVRTIGGEPSFQDWKPEKQAAEAISVDVPVLTISAAAITPERVVYDVPQKTCPEVRNLSDEELAYLNVGAFDPKGGVLSIIGNASKSVPGAAGESTDLLKNKGFGSLVMADGPAGLRLSQQYTVDKKGKRNPIGETMPATILELMPPAAAFVMSLITPKPKKNAVIHAQYATAIPIGTAIAQSWNKELAYICGDIVGAEMERFGVHLWLAPALNIHRNIRCGRNFEYYSEDPLISGVFAAEITKGVQRHPGCGTTIKHYAANNQETNRNGGNSVVSQRALREIYLRGFGICIRQAQPHAVMTSYNLLNGVHTSERRDLIEDYLRSECGFEGLVMTDWLVDGFQPTDGYPIAKASKIAAAGGDLVMPGSKTDVKDILAGLKNGTLTRQQLQINGTRVHRLIRLLQEKVEE